MLQILIPVLITVVSSLVWLAFYHPVGYKKLYNQSQFFQFLVYGYFFGQSISLQQSFSFLVRNNVEITEKIRNYFTFFWTDTSVTAVLILVTNVCLFLLQYLHELKDKVKKDDE